ncbi:hypothetical protein AB0L65_39230 [Nonomuraea sp. NPDC052116]|uniref:hypothetical protein n=1 Tax=Nonomuraea sp. NPDC052116 TaxID=3155665 RepID=UPI0034184BA6
MNHPDPLLDARRPWAARIWWIALAIGAACFAFVWPATPHARRGVPRVPAGHEEVR